MNPIEAAQNSPFGIAYRIDSHKRKVLVTKDCDFLVQDQNRFIIADRGRKMSFQDYEPLEDRDIANKAIRSVGIISLVEKYEKLVNELQNKVNILSKIETVDHRTKELVDQIDTLIQEIKEIL